MLKGDAHMKLTLKWGDSGKKELFKVRLQEVLWGVKAGKHSGRILIK